MVAALTEMMKPMTESKKDLSQLREALNPKP